MFSFSFRLEPTRKNSAVTSRTYPCHYLADELNKRNMTRVDYMTIDTEGSELALVEDFPWNDFDIRVVQIEQLSERKFKAQLGRKDRIIQHMQTFGYKLLSVYPVAPYDTDDLIFTRNVDEFLAQTRPHERDGDYTKRDMLGHIKDLDVKEQEKFRNLRAQLERRSGEAPDPKAIMALRRATAVEELKARRRQSIEHDADQK